jgi:hypothetical protein
MCPVPAQLDEVTAVVAAEHDLEPAVALAQDAGRPLPAVGHVISLSIRIADCAVTARSF